MIERTTSGSGICDVPKNIGLKTPVCFKHSKYFSYLLQVNAVPNCKYGVPR